MRHHQWVSDLRHAPTQPRPLATLGWTQFVIVGIVIVAVLVLTGALILPQ